MQEFYLIINWIVAIALLGLGSVSLLKSRSLTLNRVFALFTVTVGIWIIASYISNDVHNSPRVSVIGNYFVFLFSYISGYLLLWFAVALADDHKAAVRLKKSLLPIVLAGVTTCTPLVVAGAKRQGSVYAVQFGPFVVVYFVGILLLLGSAIFVLHKNIKIKKGDQKSHMVVLYRCLGIAIPVLLLTEFILPAVTGWFGLTNVGILAMAIPVVGLYYSVIKFKLFNLRLAIVRSLSYVITVAVISAVYSIISYRITTLARVTHNDLIQEVLTVLLIIIAINTYQPMLKVFRRWTNRLFYQDAYDAQELFSELNRLLVSTIDLRKLLTNTSKLVVDNIKTSFCLFDLGATDYSEERIFGSVKPLLKNDDFAQLRVIAAKIKHRVIVVDDLKLGHGEFKKVLEANNVAVIIRLSNNLSHVENGLGFMLLGPKSSGNPYGADDLRVLDTLANELTVAIQNILHYEEIQKFNLTLQAKVDEATRKLRNVNEKLKVLDETKDDFISMASHQLRTPLTSIKGYISMVLEGDAGKLSAQQEQMLGQAFFSSQRMVFLIADLLNLSRLKTGKFIIDPSPVNLADVVEQELQQLKEAAASRGHVLEFVKPASFPTLMLDETKMRQVIMNFTDNAIYYTPNGGHIIVRLVDTPSTIELRIEDNGIGVSKHEQQHLFTKFFRAGNARKARPDGTGLGLFMAKKVIVASGGSLIFSTEEGKGSTFGFSFVKSRFLPPAAVAPVALPVVPAPASK